jgi:hypothetical protein
MKWIVRQSYVPSKRSFPPLVRASALTSVANHNHPLPCKIICSGTWGKQALEKVDFSLLIMTWWPQPVTMDSTHGERWEVDNDNSRDAKSPVSDPEAHIPSFHSFSNLCVSHLCIFIHVLHTLYTYTHTSSMCTSCNLIYMNIQLYIYYI